MLVNTPQSISDTKYYPLTFSQQRIWFMGQLNPESAAYNCPTAIRLQGDLDYQSLELAFQSIIERHSSLHSHFMSKEGQPYRIVSDHVNFKLSFLDISDTKDTEIEIKVRQLGEEEAVTLFDLARDLPIRGKVLRLGELDYVLLLTIHHIIWDYWSWWILWQEVSTVYNAISTKKEYQLKSLPIGYEDYTSWQQEKVASEEWQKQREYWGNRFKENLPILDLPNDFKRPNIQTYWGKSQELVLEPEVSKKLRKLAFNTRTSLFIVLLAAYNCFLARYTNQEDLIVGIPIAGRNDLNVKSLIGCFVNTLPIRSNVEGKTTFIELAKNIGQEVLAANDNQLYPFEELIQDLNIERDMSRSPLFQTVFMFRDELLDGLNLSGIKSSKVTIPEQTAKFDLTACVYPTAESLKIEFEYNTDLFTAETIHRMLSNFATLLKSITSDPETEIAQFDLLTSTEKQQILQDWNQTQAKYPQNSCIHHLIETQVKQTPKKTAVVFGDREITYRELNSRANQMANYLKKLGVTRETLVGICLDRSVEMLVSMLAILKAGGAYIPLDPNYPVDRLALMVEDSQLNILITKTKSHVISNYTGKIVNLDLDSSTIALESEANLDSPVTPESLAYIIYTSGSTGRPKGVQLEHQGVVNFLNSMAQKPGITPDDVLLAVTSISFDIAVLELFLPLTVGAKIILASQSETINGIKLLRMMAKSGVTMMQATPASWKMLQAGKWDKIQPIKMLCGGEAMSEELADWMLEQSSSLWNVYGPTEATIWATVNQILADERPIAIGSPLANTTLNILDCSGKPVPIGVAGEIHIGGVQLARGYLNRPQLTQERFIPSPFNRGERLYKTGDLGRYLKDGKVECLGRLDNQVKVRGFRIELGEIEANLIIHPEITNCVVTAREDIPGDKRLVAYLIAKSESILEVKDLRSFLQQKLPHYMIPSHFIFLEKFPLTPNGKIDRKNLPAPNNLVPNRTEEFIAPRNDIEQQVASIWIELLDIKRVSINDSFFDLGGHSLLAVTLFDRIEQLFQQKLPLATLFQAPTIGQLSNIIKQKKAVSWQSLVKIKPEGSKPPLFCIHGAGGNVLHFRQLADCMDEQQPIFALQVKGFDNKQVAYLSIKEMASNYIEEIKSVRPQGPYHICGYCFGGLIAYEMAQQLKQQGEKVAFLGFFELLAPETKLTKINLARFYIRQFLYLDKKERAKYVMTRLLTKNWQSKKGFTGLLLRTFFYWIKRFFSSTTSELSSDKANLFRQVYLNSRAAAKDYNLVSYRGNLHLFISEISPLAFYSKPDAGWSKFISGEVETHNVLGTHENLFARSHAESLAKKLQVCLDNTNSTSEHITTLQI